MSTSLIIGAGGQDGRLLTDHLKNQHEKLVLVGNGWISWENQTKEKFDLFSQKEVEALVLKIRPDRIFYLAAFHHSSSQAEHLEESSIWEKSEATHVTGFRFLLESTKKAEIETRIFYAASSLVFGNPESAPQNEDTPFNPVCVYGITKTTGVHIAQYYRKLHQMHIDVGYLYTHESPLRSNAFVAKKIVNGLKDVHAGKETELVLGDLNARVDWGYAQDYVQAIDLIGHQAKSNDYIIATGESHSVREFAEIGCRILGLSFEKTVRESNNQTLRKRRNLVGDFSRLKKATGWTPSMSFEKMVQKLFEV